MTFSADHALDVRECLLARLKEWGYVRAIVGSRIYDEPPPEPEWPFVRYGGLYTESWEAQCMEGSSHRVVIHGFDKGPGQDGAAQLGQAIQLDLKDESVIDGLDVVDYQWMSTEVLPDPEVDGAYHVLVNYQITVVETRQPEFA